MTAVCPCCAQPISGEDVDLVAFFGGNAALILDAIIEGGGSASADQIISHVYGLNPNGGPMTAANCVRVTICRIRPDLNALGYDIIANPHASHSAYRLVRLGARKPSYRGKRRSQLAPMLERTAT